jgi:YD repeat-containing protein
MHLVYKDTTGTTPPGLTVVNAPFLPTTNGQTTLPYVNTSTTVNGGQDFTYALDFYNGGTSTITNLSIDVVPDRQHRRFGGRLENTKLGWVLQEADRIMKCLAIGKDNVTGATYSSATVPVSGYKNLVEIYQGQNAVADSRVWFLVEEMALKRHVDTATGQATIVFDKATVGVKTESDLLGVPASPGVAGFATHLQANFDAFAAREFPVISPDDPTGQTIVNLKIFKMLKDAMQAVSLARFFRDNSIPLDMWWMNGWKAPVAYSSRSVPTIVNEALGVYLYGGVETSKPNSYTPSASAQSVGSAVSSSRPADTLHPTEDLKQQAWTATTGEGTFKAVAASMNAGQSEGILNLAETDLSFASPGALSLEFTRYYQSGYVGDDGMGPGWRAGRYVLQFERPSWFDEHNKMTYFGSQLVPRDALSDTRLRSGAVRLVDLATGATLDFQSSFTVAYSLNASGNPVVSLAGLTAEEVPVFTAGTRKDGTELVQNDDGVLGYSAYLPDGSVLVFDPEGRLEIAVDRHGYAQWYFRDGQSRVTTIQDSANRTLTLAYDATSGRLASVTGPVSEGTDYNYDTSGRLETVVHQRSSAVIARYSYNADNQLLDVQRMDGTKLVTTTPDLKGRSDERTDGRSNAFDYGYYQDATTGTKTTQIQDVASTLAPSVQTTDAQGRTTTVADPLSNTVSFGYDGASLLPTSVKLPTADRPAITIVRNGSGQPTSISDPAVVGAQAIGLTYNAANRVTQVTDETGRAIQAVYNDAQDLTKVRRFLGTTPVEVGYGYLNGYLRTVTNPLNKSWTMVRDTYGRVTSVVDPTNVTLTMEYDSLGRLWRVTDPRLSSAMTYTFDDLDRVETITTPAGVTRYSYDPVTKWLKTITDVQNRTVTFTYDDSNGDVTKASYAMPVAGGGTTTLETNYSYARFGDLKTVAAPGAQPTTFKVDDLGRVTGTTEVEAGLFDVPRGLASNHATSGVWSNQKNHAFSWGAPESSSPVNGYNFTKDATAGQSVTTTAPTSDWNNVSDGQHTAHVRARNEGGFWSPEAIFALWVDATPPVLSGWGFSPAIIPSGQANTNQTVSVTVNDALSGTTGQVPTIHWCISGDATRNWSSYTPMTSGGGNQWSYIINANWPQSIGKKLYYQVQAGDVAGNITTSPEMSQNITNGEPAWWVSPVSIFDGQPKDNLAVINVGQLKHVATQAKAYLDTKLGLTVADWNTAYGTNPNPFTSTAFTGPQTDPENFSVANIGQLKLVASGFYTILKNKSTSYDVKAKLYAIGVTDSYISGASGGPFYPWSSDGLENSAPVTVGQLKVVFSFELP